MQAGSVFGGICFGGAAWRGARVFLLLLLGAVAALGVTGCQSGRTRNLSSYDRSVEPKLTVYLVRHAQAYKNVSPWLRPGGLSKDDLDALTPRGMQQAEAVGRSLADKGISLVLASPTRRTKQTAEAIAKAVGVDGVRVDPAFVSLKNGKTPSGETSTMGWRQAEWKAGRDPRPEGGESLVDALTRSRMSLEQIAEENPGAKIAVVSHGEIVAFLLSYGEGTPVLESIPNHLVQGASVSVIRLYDAPRWRVDAEGVRPGGK